MLRNNYYILTGAMGGGKSTILKSLIEHGYTCMPEPARQILKEQRSSGKEGTPDKDPARFNELMLEKMIMDYENNQVNDEIIIFDRGIPDVIAYAELLNTDGYAALKAANEYKYNNSVFMFSAWKEIYANDEERRMSFELSAHFEFHVRKVYAELGYEIIDVPLVPVSERVEFLKKFIGQIQYELE